jgi:hypothetical protein
MTLPPIRLAVLALCAGMLAPGVFAESLASSASSAGSASSGSVSDSIKGSSDSSSGKQQTAQGDYRVIDVAAIEGKPEVLRVSLRAVEAGEDRLAAFTLDVPRQALGARTLTVGDTVRATPRPYGIEFARAAGPRAAEREAFFLVLADDWHAGLEPRAVEL